MELVPHEYARSSIRFTSGNPVAVMSVLIESPFVAHHRFHFVVPLYRDGPNTLSRDTVGHIAIVYGGHLLEIIVRQVRVDGVLYFRFLLRNGLTGPWTFQDSKFDPKPSAAEQQLEALRAQIVKRRVKRGDDFTLYVVSYARIDEDGCKIKSYVDEGQLTESAYFFLLCGVTNEGGEPTGVSC